MLNKFYEDANDQHVTRVIGYVNPSENYAGIYADAEFTKLIEEKELYRLCCLGILVIDQGNDTFYTPVAYSEEACSIVDTEVSESTTTLVLRTITFAAE